MILKMGGNETTLHEKTSFCTKRGTNVKYCRSFSVKWLQQASKSIFVAEMASCFSFLNETIFLIVQCPVRVNFFWFVRYKVSHNSLSKFVRLTIIISTYRKKNAKTFADIYAFEANDKTFRPTTVPAPMPKFIPTSPDWNYHFWHLFSKVS